MSGTALWLWFAIPALLGILSDSPKPLWLTPIGLLVAAYFGTLWLVRLPGAVKLAREQRVEADYRETLRLIDWREKPRTAVDDVLDALEVERSE